jgi:hypothetical protein
MNPMDYEVMALEELVVWLFGCYGVCFLLCSSTLLSRPRDWLVGRVRPIGQLLDCYFCTGFWVALVLGGWILQSWFWSVLYGFAGASFCYGLDAAIRRLERSDEFDVTAD